METKSRVQKYEPLRSTMADNQKEAIEAPKLSRYAKRLHEIDAEYFQPIVENLDVQPLKKEEPARAKRSAAAEENDEYFNEQEILARALRLSANNEQSSDDDLLNQFLKEIRSYNQAQGLRSQDDTKMEILKQVKDLHSDAVKESNKQRIVNVASQEDLVSKKNIARQVRELLNKGDSKKQENAIEIFGSEREDVSLRENLQQDREHRAKLMEETQQLRVQLSEHEEELDEIGTGIDYTRKLLNLLLVLLLVTVLIAGAILAWLVTRG